MHQVAGIKRFFYLNTYGWIAIASILICTLSGVLLAISFDIGHPYLSITTLLITNPAASFIRNVHFWSAQAFLLFTILHIYDHLKKSTENNISNTSTWFRLTLSVAFLGYVMISGFILKADADSLQAKRILSALLESIPWLGRLLQQTFIGPEGNWQLLYVQHIATATIILFIAIYDHVHTIWVNRKTFLIVLLAIGILSWLFRAPLSSLNDQLMKGPWYFVGLQELLHWIRRPWIIMLLVFLLLAIIYALPRLGNKIRAIVKKVFLGIILLYILLSLIGFIFRGTNWQWQWPWKDTARIRTVFVIRPLDFRFHPNQSLPLVQGQVEACLVCHSGMKGLSISHSESFAGCYSCHLGDPFTLNKELAHKGMELVPGNLSNAAHSCGTSKCHPQIIPRVNGSLMASLTGIISVDRFVFGESPALDGHAPINDLRSSAADKHLRNLCAGCHLGSAKLLPGPAKWLERGGGCNACHLTYFPEAKKDLEFQNNKSRSDTTSPKFHPSINLAISNDKCKSCHSRSGRISMNYEGWHETLLNRIPTNDPVKYQALPDGRVFQFVIPDIHHEKGISCIDCHSSYELMGDSKSYAHKEDAVKIQCSDCHPDGKATRYLDFQVADKETILTAWLRNFTTIDVKMVATEKENRPLVNAFVDKHGQVNLISKLSGIQFISKPQSPACNEGSAHSRLSCNACHTAWAPQCIGCHNSYEKQAAGFDMLSKKNSNGSWVEYTGKYLAELPVLGVNMNEGKQGTIQTFVPGMILTIDKGSFNDKDKTIFHRLYAPVSAHTTQRESRSCKSCHNNPLALGYGRGKLYYSQNGQWTFAPQYAVNINDGLPEDAWTGFLKARKGISSTRSGYRPFDREEQKRILTVGACLTCHESTSAVMKRSLVNYKGTLSRRTNKCRIPVW